MHPRSAFVIMACLVARPALGQACDPQWISGGIPNPNGIVYATAMWDRDGSGPLPPALVVGGSFTLVGALPVSNLALWDGVAWSDVGGGVSGNAHGGASVRALAVMANGDLVVGGAFDDAGTGAGRVAANCIARYTGSSWAAFGQGLPNLSASVLSLSTRGNGDLLAVGGLFTNNDGSFTGPLARWNDTVDPANQWRSVAPGYPDIASLRVVRALANGDVVIGGVASANPGTSAAWRWSDTTNAWQSFGDGITGTAPLNQVLSILEAANGDIVFAGNFTSAGGLAVNSIARWSGKQFFAYGSGITYPGQNFQLAVRALAQMPNGDIVAGGQFDTAGGNVGGRIARWDGATWSRLPQGAGDIVWTLLRMPAANQNELIIGGAYTFAGGSFANKRVARFADSPAPWAARHPDQQTIATGETVTLSATCATAFNSVAYRWQRDGVDVGEGAGGASAGGGFVAGAVGALVSPSDGSAITLTISGARTGDSGVYRVVFTNSCGSGVSDGAAVTVVASVCSADFNHSGSVDSQDFFDFVAAFFSGAADFNHDHDTNSQDFFDFLAAFFNGC